MNIVSNAKQYSKYPFFMVRRIFIVFFLLFISTNCFSQRDIFRFFSIQEEYKMPFKLINNLIIIPIEVNHSELNFLLDTGVSNTIMFNLEVKDSLKLRNIEKVRLRGLGEGEYLDAYKSTGNYFKMGKIVNGNHMIYLIPGKKFDLSSQMGTNISGIIGGDLFHDFIIDINYNTKRLHFYKPDGYTYSKCKKCKTFDLKFYKKKPYITLTIQPEKGVKTEVKLLIDSGGSDALWLFEKTSKDIKVPEKHFVDYLGKGLSGNIYGKRSKIHKITIGDYFFMNANVAFPDSSSVETAYRHKERDGTLGSEILKRFRIIFDYPNKKITFKKKSNFFKDPFLYNMSGMELSYSGTMLVREREQKGSVDMRGTKRTTSTVIEIVYDYVYAFKKSYRITALRKESPAKNAGLALGDVILQINGKPAYTYKLEQITHMFSIKEGKQIRLLIDRDGEILSYAFRLKKML